MYSHPGFVLADYCVFGATVLISLGIGIFYAFSGGRQSTTSEYLVGNRQMKILPLALSLMVSFESSIMMLGFPAEAYVYGLQYIWYNVGVMTGLLLGLFIVVPLIYPLKLTSVYEYMELRFQSKWVRVFAMIIGAMYYIFYMGIVLFGPAIALESVTDFPYWASVLAVALGAMLYTSIGGIKAVIWTDVFQTVVMMTGIFAILIQGTISAGGVGNVFNINKATKRLDILDFNPDPFVRHTFWTLFVGNTVKILSIAFNQSSIQRISSTPKMSMARKIFLITGPLFCITLSLPLFEGLVAYAYYYKKRCDPLTSGRIKNPNQIIPYLVLEIFEHLPGMPGLFMASLFSASLSTLSSGLSSLSAMAAEDIVKQIFPSISDQRLTFVSKLSVLVSGALSIAVSFMIAGIKGPMSQISSTILGCFTGTLSGMFLFAVFVPWATSKTTICGGLVSTLVTFWISMAKNFSKTLPRQPWLEMPSNDNCVQTPGSEPVPMDTVAFGNYTTTADTFPSDVSSVSSVFHEYTPEGLEKLYSISYMWLALIGIVICLVVGSLSALVLKKFSDDKPDVRFMLPFFDVFMPFLPKSLKQKFYFGLPFHKREELLKEYTQKHFIFLNSEKNIEVNGKDSSLPLNDAILDNPDVEDTNEGARLHTFKKETI
ncbi:sodium-coupled monocarboxylate transporter 1-like [Saccostrea echinata]|uniref:sodium-coupled monocarboxylate transporter 1-like n=1 Tax=Saccostrea echinata TaxID=191078 RepID=UPI002A831541|nr:sodium-coupled monocarboxylate transporter 1-like [Saccostrea echinata]